MYYPVRPDDILDRDKGGMLSTFGKHEVEVSADRLVKFFKSRGYWCGFTIDEVVKFYQSRDWNPSLIFFGLIGAWYDDAMLIEDWSVPSTVYIAIDTNGLHYVTDKFVEKCISGNKYASVSSD
jgi:hypothetical protein